MYICYVVDIISNNSYVRYMCCWHYARNVAYVCYDKIDHQHWKTNIKQILYVCMYVCMCDRVFVFVFVCARASRCPLKRLLFLTLIITEHTKPKQSYSNNNTIHQTNRKKITYHKTKQKYSKPIIVVS